MAARRGKSQARRSSGNSGSIPGWAWMVLGIVLAIAAMLALPRLKSEGGDGFFRPRANPDARPVASQPDEDAAGIAGSDAGSEAAAATARAGTKPGSNEPDYDFYDLLPSDEVALTDAQVAAAAREEQDRARREQARQQPATGGASTQSQPLPETPAAADRPVAVAAAPTTTPATAPARGGNDTPYVLQAGAFGASGDAEAAKARIAMLGLNARVESAQINGKTVYRVRMGPYGTASELATAKGKLANGGLPAMAIKAK